MAAAVQQQHQSLVSTDMEKSDTGLQDPTLLFQGRDVHRSDTPETMLPDFPNRPGPDISIRCEKCKTFIDLRSLKEHRLYHGALAVLKYTKGQVPKTVDVLLRRRNAVLRKLKSSATAEKPVTPEEICKINDAFEYLKSDLEGTFEELRQVTEDVNADVHGVALNCSPDCAYAVGIASSENSRWKSYMEDARVFQDCFGEDRNKCFLGLYDGHHGRFAAEVTASELHRLLLNEMAKFDPRTRSIMASNLAEEMMDLSHKFERPNTTESERVLLYDESVGIIQNIINICEEKYTDLIKKRDDSPEYDSTDRTADGSEGTTARSQKKQKSPFARKMQNAFSKVYYLVDILLSYGKDENSRIRWSGCSSLTMVIHNLKESGSDAGEGEATTTDKTEEEVSGHSSPEPPHDMGCIYLANAGNTHAVLVRGNKAYSITKDHSPANPKERNRILRDGGNFSDSKKDCRVNGVITTTRGLGNHGDPELKKCVLVEPYTTCVPIDQYAQFVILASHGVWEVFSHQEAASLLIKLLPSNYLPAPSKISSTLRSLFEDFSNEQSRRVSLSSVGSLGKGERLRSGQRSALQSVKEESLKGEGRSHAESPMIEIAGGQDLSPDSRSDKVKSRNQHHSTPTDFSSKQGSGSRRVNLIDVDMTTEVGSHRGNGFSDDDDSGNDGDVDTYMENMTLPDTFSRLSMAGCPPTAEYLRREHAKMMAEHLVQAALLAGARDNITVMVVLLPGTGL